MSEGEDFFERVGSEPRPRRNRSSEDSATPVAVDEQWMREPRNRSTEGGSSWASSGDTFWQVGKNYSEIPPGIYRCDMVPHIGPCFIKVKNQTDGLIRFPESESTRLLDEMRQFQGMRDKFTKHGFLHKRGVLLYGPPGGGKTSTIQLLLDLVVKEHNGIAILIDRPQFAVACLQVLRSVEPDRQAVGILEDLDGLVERYGESEYLALLDGESQVDRMIYVATCFVPETRFLTSDLRWVPCGDLKIGDELWGFDESRPEGRGARRAYKKSVVTMSHLAKKECVRVHLNTGESFVCTTDHPWLSFGVQRETYRLHWTPASELLTRPHLVRPFKPWEVEGSWEAGWLAGILDGEGCICSSGTNGRVSHVSVSQNSGPTSDRIARAILDRVDANVYQRNGKHERQVTIDTRGGMATTAKLIGQVRAERLINRFDLTGVRVKKHFEAKVVAVEPVGEMEIQSIQTSSHTYIAEGFACHNTNYPERLDARFVDRPSRFDTIRYIGMPSSESRAVYFEAKVPELDSLELDAYVAASDGYSVAHMRELIILTRCFDVSLTEAKRRLDRTRKLKPSSAKAPDAPAFGFGSGGG